MSATTETSSTAPQLTTIAVARVKRELNKHCINKGVTEKLEQLKICTQNLFHYSQKY